MLRSLSPFGIKDQKEKASAVCHESENHLPEPVVGYTIGDTKLAVPVRCTHHPVRKASPCSESLFNTVGVNGKAYVVPRCKYEMQDLKQWIGHLLSQPAIREQVFKAFRRPRKEDMEDMWDTEHLCKILLKKGEQFLPRPDDETRLAFSFSMDSFNPFHLKEAKQTVLSTAIWLILLNLPPHLRYSPENMFLAGIIPGPKKPSLSDVNHSLKLLVDVLLEFFDPGVWYSRTAKHSQGCQVHAILIPVVSDMLAARQAGGFASPTATCSCTHCNLKIQDIESLNRSTWPKRDVTKHICVAKCWRDTQSLDEQERLFSNHGIRWSPLLELPYWNPIAFTAIEPMHVFDLGLFQNHCQQVWGINVSTLGGDGKTVTVDVPRPPDSNLEKWYETI